MRAYEKKDYADISRWCALRDVAPPPEWALPENGFFSPDLAAGFLILTDTKVGIIDFYISNPLADKVMKSRALDRITQKLLEIAKDNDLKMVICSTKNEAIKKRALRNGFREGETFTSFSKGV